MKHGMRKRLLAIGCAYLLLGSTAIADGAPADAFKTPEYYGSNGLDVINAADAYALGYTGKGIRLGICDDYVWFGHNEFINKQNSAVIGVVPGDYDWRVNNHGTHVAGIMAAAKDDFAMHGLAFEAEVLSGSYLSSLTEGIRAAYGAFNHDSRVKIINNSWGWIIYYDELRSGRQGLIEAVSAVPNFLLMANSMAAYDKVLVFAAGNDGHATPALLPIALTFSDENARNNLINVVAVNANEFDAGAQAVSGNFLALFSNLTKYVEENSVAAPGWSIYSLSTDGPDYYVDSGGTSMATPHVSAAGGLVQQAFPYMNGKQLVDTVLSTANRTFALPAYTLTVQRDAENAVQGVNLFYFGARPSAAVIEAQLRQYYAANHEELRLASAYGLDTVEAFLAAQHVVYDNVPREMVFGQGLLDVGAAVRGPGLLNARRLDYSSYSPAAEYGKEQALYAINTAGYDSVWSNNIGETRAGLLAADSPYEDLKQIYAYYKQGDALYGFAQGQEYIDAYNARVTANGLQHLPVGLLKQGAGTLVLTGNNTYQGSSIAAGGVLQIDGSVAGDAVSVAAGTLAGTGRIKGRLVNTATVQPGQGKQPGTLTVEGDFASSGKIAIVVQDGANGSLAVLGAANIEGSSFVPVAGSVYRPDSEYVALTAGSIAGSFATTPFTGLLSAAGVVEGNRAKLVLARENNLGSLDKKRQQTYRQMDAMYDRLAGQSAQRELDSLYNLNAADARQALAEIYGGVQAAQASSTQRNPVAAAAISARLTQAKRMENYEVSVPLTNFAEGDFDFKTVIPLELDADNSWWLKISRGWSELDGDETMPVMQQQQTGFVVGRDKKTAEHWRTGILAAYTTTAVTSGGAKADNKDYRVGVYSGYNKAAVDAYAYLNYGQQDNEATRQLSQLGLQAESRYDSRTWSAGLAASYKLHHEQEKLWQVNPFAGVHITRYNQDGYVERGAGVFNQQAQALANTYGVGEVGVELAREIPTGRYALTVGGKKVFSGSNPELKLAYGGNPNEALQVSGPEQDKTFFVLGLNAQGALTKNWTIDGQVQSEIGQCSKALNASVMVRRCW